MVQWQKTENVQFAVAICNFPSTNGYHLPLNFGESVLIYEQTDDSQWYRGCPLTNRTIKGIFPVSHVEIKWRVECVSTNDADIGTSKEISVVLEITSVLREWSALWKQLFVKNDKDGVNHLRPLLNELINQRRQVMSGTLTADQLKQFRLDVAYTIDYGNKYLGLDLVVRDKEGNVIDVDSTGVIDLYKRHLEPARRIIPGEFRKSKIFNQATNVNLYNVHNLYVSVKNVVCKIGDDADVFITLYDGFDGFITEHYVIGWDRSGMPKDLDKLQNLSCIFTDLGQNDLQREKLYLVCQVIRDGNADSRKDDKKGLSQKLRRPFGIAVLHISDIVGGKREDTDKEIFVPLQLVGNDDVETVVKKFIQKVTSHSQVSGQGIWLTCQMMHGDLSQIREAYSLLINQHTIVARKLGFPDVIMPGDVRNDLYLTLVSGSFERGGKTSNKNVQVNIGVYDCQENLLEEVVSIGCGEPMGSEHISTVYFHNANPKWNEVVKISIPVEKVNGSTIRFAFKHRSLTDEKDKPQKVFSVSYVNLSHDDGTCLQDGVHELAVYKCEGKKSDENGYLKLPSLKSDIVTGKKPISAGHFSYSKTESFKISTKLCSTKLAQNVDLLGLLKWRSQKEKLQSILPALVKVSGEEIVKFLPDTFDALFAILMEDASKYGVMVSDAVVFCIGLLADKKYHRFRPIIDAYLENHFSATKAYITMIGVFQRNLENAENIVSDVGTEAYEQLKKYYKALEYYMKFIVRSRVLSESATPGVGEDEFQESIQKLFQTIINLMKVTTNKNLVIIQGCALKYIPAVFGDLLHVYDPVHLGHFATDMIESIPQDRLLTPKLTCIHQIVKSPLFQNERSREVLMPMLVHQLKTNMTKFEELQICADILNEILSRFHDIDLGDTDKDIEYVVLNLFRCNVETVIRMDLKGQVVNANPDTLQNTLKSTRNLKGNYVAFIVGMLDLMKEHHYIAYISSYKDEYLLLDGMMELFLVFRELVRGDIYPSDWISMTMIQNNVILCAMQYFCEYALCDRFLVGDNFQFQLWDHFFQLAVAFITQDSLQLENFSESKRNNILEKYSDMRMGIGNSVINMWHRLGVNKMRLMTNVVQPFLEMTLIPETELRTATIPVFYDMIYCEFRNRQHFKQVESEVIMHLDNLIETGMKGDEEYKELFNQILGDLFRQVKKSNPRLSELGLLFVDTITKLISRLLDYRSVISSEDNINNRMSCNVNILNFYQEIKREEMKERYLYKLCDLHLSVKSYTEAAFTLLQHAELLKWVDEPLSSANTNMIANRYDVKTQRELKEQLYKEAIDYFDKGKMWEYGISRCKELAQQYELETYNYVKLSEILSQEARFFENIIKTVVRPEPTYFRVGYFGRGFPTFLRNKLFIQRGDEFEKLSDFTMRMRVLFPVAQFLNTLDQPGEDITESVQQWIQICKVDPKPVERRRFRSKAVADQIKKFYEVNDVSEFSLNRPFHKGTRDKDNEFATLWIERITMNTEYSFPGKLRWFEVKALSKVELSPIENAIDTMKSKNKELLTLISQHSADATLNYNNFSMVLNGTIDAAVMGGYSNYEKIFFSKDYISSHPDETIFIDSLKECIVEQVDICEKGLAIHKRIISQELEPFQKKMEEQLKQNARKANPYRKKENRGRASELAKNIFSTPNVPPSSRMSRDIIPLPSRGDRNTMSPSSISGRPNSVQNRHTVIVGPSTPIGQYSLDTSRDGPPLPEKLSMTLGRKRTPLNQAASGSCQELLSGRNPSDSPPSIPRKLKTNSVHAMKSIHINNANDNISPSVSDDKPDDEEPPPMLPKKTKRDHILQRTDIDSSVPINMSEASGLIDNISNEQIDNNSSMILPPKPKSIPGELGGTTPSVSERDANMKIYFEAENNSSPRPSSHLSNNGYTSSNNSPVISHDSSLNCSPCSPRKVPVIHPSQDESSPANTSPIIPRHMPIHPSSGEISPPARRSPIIPKKMPAVPPPFNSPHTSPALIRPQTSIHPQSSINSSQSDILKTNAPPRTPILSGTNEFEEYNNGMTESYRGDDNDDSPPPPIPPRQKNM